MSHELVGHVANERERHGPLRHGQQLHVERLGATRLEELHTDGGRVGLHGFAAVHVERDLRARIAAAGPEESERQRERGATEKRSREAGHHQSSTVTVLASKARGPWVPPEAPTPMPTAAPTTTTPMMVQNHHLRVTG